MNQTSPSSSICRLITLTVVVGVVVGVITGLTLKGAGIEDRALFAALTAAITTTVTSAVVSSRLRGESEPSAG